jgi:hypothetical protein
VNFVRVLKGLFCFLLFLVKSMGGESQKASLNQVTGYSKKAQRTGNPAYLPPNSQPMQKPVEGLSAQALLNQAKVEPIYRGGIDKKSHNSRASQLL